MSMDYDGLRNHIEVLSLKAKDDSIKQNASASENAGLVTRVTRTYDNVGVHNRKDDCEWCLSRCGVDMTLQEAYEKGAFERHPGCGCEILYKTSTGTKRQTNWRNNTWSDVDDDLRRKLTERRKQRMAERAMREATQSGQIKYSEKIPDDTKKLVDSLSAEYRTRLKSVSGGAVKAAGDVDITGEHMRVNSKSPNVIIHEFAHTLANSSADKYGLTHDNDFWKEIKQIRRQHRKAVREGSGKSISVYGDSHKNNDEWMAESFALAKMREKNIPIPLGYGDDTTYSQRVLETVNKYFKKRNPI